MIEHYFLKPETCDGIRASWLGEPIQRYVTWLNERGYAARNVFRRVPTLMRFGRYTQERGAKAWTDLPDHVEPFVAQWIHDRGRNCRDEEARQSMARSIRNPIQQMLHLVLPEFAGKQRNHLPSPSPIRLLVFPVIFSKSEESVPTLFTIINIACAVLKRISRASV